MLTQQDMGELREAIELSRKVSQTPQTLQTSQERDAASNATRALDVLYTHDQNMDAAETKAKDEAQESAGDLLRMRE
jgi:hypothetical protein